MKAIWMKRGVITLLATAMTAGGGRTVSEPSTWEYEYSGDAQRIEITSTGTYQFELYGAQGESYQSHAGGRGGMVNVQVELNRGDNVELLIGGSDGYNGGGEGTLTHGGGATTLKINGELAAIAGGGGGATDILNGGSGGEMQGGGAENSSGESNAEPYSAGGGGGYLGGLSGCTSYHKHTGNEYDGGGCYTSAVKHVHTGECYVRCGEYENFRLSSDREGYVEANCGVCGDWSSKPGDMDSDFIYDGSWTHTKRICNKENGTVEGYQLSCGRTESAIEGNTQAYGGTSFYDLQMCRNGLAVAGVRTGNGRAVMTQLAREEITVSFYNSDMTCLGTVTAMKGGTISFPLKEEPACPADDKYKYIFTGWDDMDTIFMENVSSDDIVNTPLTENKNYIAVYRTVPREYQVTLHNGASDTETITAAYGKPMPKITLPSRGDALFAGYYSQENGQGRQYYLATGESACRSDMTEAQKLYAYWVQPLTITKQPDALQVERDYDQAEMKIEYQVEPIQGYTVTTQWYEQKHSPRNRSMAAGESTLQIPQGYDAGEYSFWCELTVTSDANKQKLKVSSERAVFTVNKAEFIPGYLTCEIAALTYDGKPHSIVAKVDIEEEYTLYYAMKPLTKSNYLKEGTTKPYTYANAGKYVIYVYVTSPDYEDYAGSIEMTIEKARWEVTQNNYPVVNTDGTITLPGKEQWEYCTYKADNEAYHNYQGTKLEAGEYLFRIQADSNHLASIPVRLTVKSLVPEESTPSAPNPGNSDNGTTGDKDNAGTGNAGSNPNPGNSDNGTTGGDKDNAGTGTAGSNPTPDNSDNGNTGDKDNTGTGNNNPGQNSGGSSTGNTGDKDNTGTGNTGSNPNPDNSNNGTTEDKDNAGTGTTSPDKNPDNSGTGNAGDKDSIGAGNTKPGQNPGNSNTGNTGDKNNTGTSNITLTSKPDNSNSENNSEQKHINFKESNQEADTSLTTIPEVNPWKADTAASNTRTADSDKVNLPVSEPDITEDASGSSELTKAADSFIWGIGILGLIAILILALFLSSGRVSLHAEE